MPTAIIYYDKNSDAVIVEAFQPADMKLIKSFLAELLSCGDRKLDANEISVRIQGCNGLGMIAPLEIDITANHYPERVQQQDEICLKVEGFFKALKIIRMIKSKGIKVWLKLCELGHGL